MTVTAFLLILLSAGLHASWNMVAKKNRMTVPFYTVICTTAMMFWIHVQFWTPVVVWSLPGKFWLMLYASVFSDAIYCLGLMEIYKRMEMATAYPVMRSLPIILTTLAATLLGWGKPLTAVSCLGFLIVFFGAFIMPLNSFSDFKLSHYLNMNMLFILVAACGTTGYTIFDSQAQHVLKSCAQEIPASLRSLTYYSTRGMALSSTLWLICFLFKSNRQDLLAFRDRKLLKQGILAGIFASFSYLLVLCAMNYVTNVTYVQVFRQLGLPIGMVLGVLILKEHCTLNKIIGLVLILTGLIISVLN